MPPRLSLIAAVLLVVVGLRQQPPERLARHQPPRRRQAPSPLRAAVAVRRALRRAPTSTPSTTRSRSRSSQIRGLEPSATVERRFIDEDELRTLITEQFDEETPPEYIAATERLYKALGLIPDDADLRDLTSTS